MKWRRRLHSLRSLRFSVKAKTFLKLLLIFIIPFALTGAFFIESQRRTTERLVFESFLVRIRLVAIDLENALKDQAYLSTDNPALLANLRVPERSDAARTPQLPDAIAGARLPADLREAADDVAPDHRSLLFFFNTEDGSLLLFFARRDEIGGQRTGRWLLYLFDAAFLEDEALANTNVAPEETLFLTGAKLQPILSSRIETDFRIPREWTQGLQAEFKDGLYDGLRVITINGERQLVLCSRFEGLPLIGILTRPYDAAMAPVYSAVKQQALILLLVAIALFLFSGMLAREQIRPLRKIQALMEGMAEHRYEPLQWNRGNDERRDIMKMLNRMRGRLSRYHSINVERVIIQEARFKTILGNISEGILTTDRNFTPILLNGRTSELLGPGAGEFLRLQVEQRGLLDLAEESNAHFFETEVESPELGRRYLEVALQPSPTGRHFPGGFLAVLRDVTDRKLSFDREIEFAAQYQEQFLPDAIPSFPRADFHLSYIPYIAVGGDYYDFIDLGEDRHMILLADMMGHGVQAALFISLLRVSFREIVLRTPELNQVVEGLNHVFYAQVPTTVLVPYVLFIYDARAGRIDYAIAGHPPMQLLRGSERIELIRNNLAAGMKRKVTGNFESIDLQDGDFLFCSTDGITDVENAAGDMFGEERMIAALGAHAQATDNCADFSEGLSADLLKFSQGRPYPDDITWFALRYMA
ncbi:MAG: SpoIIE family protein phosphatase [bacterium]|nr:SpoIIE family protein phosphatase [bacterium]